MADLAFPTQLLNELLRTPSIEEQTVLLSATGFATNDGLSALLDEAERLMGVDPDQSQRLTQLARSVSSTSALPVILPRTAYLSAQIDASRGDFVSAQQWIEAAQLGYNALNMRDDALRTNVGLMAILGDTGNYHQALSVGRNTLAELGIVENGGVQNESPAQQRLAAAIFQNCGHCNEAIGQYDAALADYHAARMRFEALGVQERLGQVIENVGLVYISLGEVQRGLAALEEALAIYQRANLELFQAETYFNIGEAQLLLSNFVESLRAFERTEQLLDALGDLLDRHLLLRLKADAYLALNLYSEALGVYREALQGLRTAGVTYHHAFAAWGMGVALAAQQQWNEARNVLEEAATLFRTLKNAPLLAAVSLEQAALLHRQGNNAGARQLAAEQLRLVADSNWNVQKIYAYLSNADLALPDTMAAEQYLLAAEPLVNALGLPQLRFRFAQRLGHLRMLQGDAPQAELYLRRAIDEIEKLRGTLLQDHMRASFLNDKIGAYQDLVQIYVNRGDMASIQQAFEIAERAKSRALVDLLSGVIQAGFEQAGDDASQVELQRLQSELNAIYNDLLARDTNSATGDGENRLRAVNSSQLHNRAIELEQAISRARLRHVPQNLTRSVYSAEPIQPQQWLASLPADLTMLVYHVVGDEIMAFACQSGKIHVVRHLASTSEILQLQTRLTVHWERFRIDAAVLMPHMAQLQRSVQRILQTLFQSLIEPVLYTFTPVNNLPATQPVRNLVIVPHSLLHQLPFHALYDGEHYLIESFAISYAPSATVFDLCQKRSTSCDGRALVVGMADASIPAVELEARNVERQLVGRYASVEMLLNEQAKISRLAKGNSSYDLVHFACHGLFRQDNPMFSSLKLFDGWLTAADVSQLNFSGSLVTLSACESGTSQVSAGDEILGLTYAFLSAGAATLVVSQWLVQDRVTASLMECWYRNLLNCTDLAASLRLAQLEIMRSFPHPYFWAPFKLVGQRVREVSH